MPCTFIIYSFLHIFTTEGFLAKNCKSIFKALFVFGSPPNLLFTLLRTFPFNFGNFPIPFTAPSPINTSDASPNCPPYVKDGIKSFGKISKIHLPPPSNLMFHGIDHESIYHFLCLSINYPTETLLSKQGVVDL